MCEHAKSQRRIQAHSCSEHWRLDMFAILHDWCAWKILFLSLFSMSPFSSHKMTHRRALAGGGGPVLQQRDAPFSVCLMLTHVCHVLSPFLCWLPSCPVQRHLLALALPKETQMWLFFILSSQCKAPFLWKKVLHTFFPAFVYNSHFKDCENDIEAKRTEERPPFYVHI